MCAPLGDPGAGGIKRRHDNKGSTMTKKTVRLPRTAVSLIAASGLAVTGAAALATGWVATATPGDPHQVWVCKYVQKPHQNEVLKAGKNPILVDWASLTGKEQAPKIGATFSDGQDKSVVVKIGGSNPGVGACGVSIPPTSTTTSVPSTSTSTTTVPSSTTSSTTSTTSTATTSTAPSGTSTVPGGGGGGNGGGGNGGGGSGGGGNGGGGGGNGGGNG